MKYFYRRIFFSLIILLVCIDLGSEGGPILAILTRIVPRLTTSSRLVTTRVASFGSHLTRSTISSTRLLKLSRPLESVSRRTFLESAKFEKESLKNSKTFFETSRLLESVSRNSILKNVKFDKIFLRPTSLRNVKTHFKGIGNTFRNDLIPLKSFKVNQFPVFKSTKLIRIRKAFDVHKLYEGINRFEYKQFYTKHLPNRIKHVRHYSIKFNPRSKSGLKGSKGRDLKNLKYSIRDGKVCLGDYCLDFPNRQRIGRIDKLELRKPTDGSSPINEYQMGPNDRIEYLSARVYPQHLRTGKRPSLQMRERTKVMGSTGDDTGHLIAKSLGGPGDEAFNFFPQKMGINRGIWRLEEKNIANALRSGKVNYVEMKFNFKYKNQLDTRPDYFMVDFEYDTAGRSSGYSRSILNKK